MHSVYGACHSGASRSVKSATLHFQRCLRSYAQIERASQRVREKLETGDQLEVRCSQHELACICSHHNLCALSRMKMRGKFNGVPLLAFWLRLFVIPEDSEERSLFLQQDVFHRSKIGSACSFVQQAVSVLGSSKLFLLSWSRSFGPMLVLCAHAVFARVSCFFCVHHKPCASGCRY